MYRTAHIGFFGAHLIWRLSIKEQFILKIAQRANLNSEIIIDPISRINEFLKFIRRRSLKVNDRRNVYHPFLFSILYLDTHLMHLKCWNRYTVCEWPNTHDGTMRAPRFDCDRTLGTMERRRKEKVQAERSRREGDGRSDTRTTKPRIVRAGM